MKILRKSKPVLLLLGVFVVAALMSYVVDAADPITTVVTSGWSWSSNIGWLHGNNCPNPNDSGCTSNYNITALPTAPGTISGYAWSSNLGWISFNSDIGCPIYGCTPGANVDWSANGGVGPFPVKGWARACSVFVNGCSGPLKVPAYLGGWDGFIALSGTNGSATWGPTVSSNKMSGYAWGSQVIGWIQMNFDMTTVTKLPQCSDLVDNDGDGKIDVLDPGCWTDITDPNTYDPADDSEYNDNEPLPSITIYFGGLISINLLVIYLFLVKLNVFPYLFTDVKQGGFFTALMIAFAILYYNKNKSAAILNKYSSESEKERKSDNLIVVVYIGISFLLIFVVAFFRPQKL